MEPKEGSLASAGPGNSQRTSCLPVGGCSSRKNCAGTAAGGRAPSGVAKTQSRRFASPPSGESRWWLLSSVLSTLRLVPSGHCTRRSRRSRPCLSMLSASKAWKLSVYPAPADMAEGVRRRLESCNILSRKEARWAGKARNV